MKIKSLKAKGIGWLHEEITLPIDELGDASVIAITGLNGSGKSSLCELVPGLLYGDTPSHGPVAAMANAKDSYIEGVFETDQTYRLRRTINATLRKPKIEAYAWNEKGEPVGESDGKQTTFAAEVGKRFPSEAVYLASGFASQGRVGQFLEVSKSERKALFADLIGLEGLQQMSKTAGERAKAIDAQVVELRAKVEALEEQAGQLSDLKKRTELRRADLELHRGEREKAEATATDTRERLDKWGQQAAELDKRVSDVQLALTEARQQHERISEKQERTIKNLAQVTAEMAVLRTKLSKKNGLLSAVVDVDTGRLPEIDAEIAEIRKAVEAHRDAERGWRAKKSEAEDEYRSCGDAYKEALRTATSNERMALQQCRALDEAASGLTAVPCRGEAKYSECPLLDTATKAAAFIDKARQDLENARASIATAKADTDAGFKAKAALEAVGDAPEPPDTSRLDPLEREAKDIRSRQAEVVDAKARLDALADVEERLSRLETESARLLTEKAADHDALADKATVVASAEGKLLAIRDKRADHEAEKPQVVDETALAALRRRETATTAALAQLESQVEAATDAAGKVKKAQVEISTVTADLDDWRHLQKAFGRDGIQSLEVDAAGPDVSSLINKLLGSCYGPRFVAKLETTAPMADGKGTKEIFDLHVLDTEKGWEGSASHLSGGEKVIVAEALGLAIAIYNAQRSSIPILDIVRDECSGALDFEKAPLYVTMLRKAIEIGGFHRIFFIAHQKDLWTLADAILEVVDGQCHVAEAA